MGYWKKEHELNNGKFIVEEILGSGGFGVTYKVRQTKTNKLFALKTLNELARSKPDFQQLQAKFINEAIALANCRHPNIVRVYPQGFQEGELWCMVMEYVKGQDLARELDLNGKFTEKKAIEIVTNVGEALGFVHQQGLLHRDIKPANILLRSSQATPVLIDFGLAREYNFNSDSIRSMTNSMTESFAPIEQYQRHGKFGAWTDVYALAATLYVLVTKQLPFPAKFREHAPLVPPQKHNPEVSDRINEAILKGMELQPGDRPQTVKEWLKLLKPPQPQSPVQPQYTEPPTIPVPPSPQQKVTAPKQPVKPINQPKQAVQETSSRLRREPENAIGSASARRGASPLGRSAIGHKNNGNNQDSQAITRRNWLKYSGLAIASMIVALVGKSVVDNSSQSTDSSESLESSLDNVGISDRPQSQENDLELAEYNFDVITVNDRGEEINREQGQAKYFTEDLGNGITLEMVEIPGGTFMMGSPEDETGRFDSESPQHEVTVPSFYMGKYEVTQAQWKAVAELPPIERELKADPSNFKGDNLPVEFVSWFDAIEFCARLSKAIGREYRLPSEAEWEYACRAGTTTPFHFGETITTDLANYLGTDLEIEGKVYPGNYANAPKGEYREKTTPVGSFSPNAFGLHDMHGNVWEWCADTWHDSYEGAPSDGSAWATENNSFYVLRGGSWLNNRHYCRSAFRFRSAPVLVNYVIGFRCIATRTL